LPSDLTTVGPLTLWSLTVGVGHKPETQLPRPRVSIDGLVWFALAVGVCNNPESLSDVRGANRASWNIKRPRGVALGLQIREYFVQAQSRESNNVLSNNPSGPEFPDNSEHFRPEMSGVVGSSLVAGMGERLTGKSAHNDIWIGFGEVGSSNIPYVSQVRDSGPVMAKHRLAVRLVLDETRRLEKPRRLKTAGKAADPREQINRPQLQNTLMMTTTTKVPMRQPM